MKHIFTTVILTLMVVESVIVTLEYWWPIFFLPVLTTLLASLFLEKIFEKYLSDDQKDKFNNKE